MELMSELVGTATAEVEAAKATPPLKSQQISDLLDALEEAGRHDLQALRCLDQLSGFEAR